MNNDFFPEEDFEYLKRQIQEDKEQRDACRKIGIEVSIKSVESIRSWVFELIAISSTIVGVCIIIGSDNPIIQHKEFLYVALLWFIIAIIFGLYKLKQSIESDIVKVPKTTDETCDIYTKVINAEEEYYRVRDKRTHDEMIKIIETKREEIQKTLSKSKEKRVYSFDFIFSLFCLGLVYIAYSIRMFLGDIVAVIFLVFITLFIIDEVKYRKNKKKERREYVR